MRDVGGKYQDGGDCSREYVSFALEVIERLAVRRRNGVGELRTALLERMSDLARSSEPDAVARVIAECREARVPLHQVADLYIPEVARAFGKDWLEDRMSFAEVTIGVGRLQQMLNDLHQDWTADLADPTNARAVLVVVPPGEQHTLGALVLASALRRQGVSVCVQIAPGMSDLSRLLEGRRFDAAMITVGCAERVEVSVKLVKTLKQLTKGRLPMAIGGAVIETCRLALEESGADLVTNDLSAVISEFGLVDHVTARRAG